MIETAGLSPSYSPVRQVRSGWCEISLDCESQRRCLAWPSSRSPSPWDADRCLPPLRSQNKYFNKYCQIINSKSNVNHLRIFVPENSIYDFGFSMNLFLSKIMYSEDNNYETDFTIDSSCDIINMAIHNLLYKYNSK